jgi:hypothetical protein
LGLHDDKTSVTQNSQTFSNTSTELGAEIKEKMVKFSFMIHHRKRGKIIAAYRKLENTSE